MNRQMTGQSSSVAPLISTRCTLSQVTGIRQAYIAAAGSAASLLADPAVAAAWHQPSALAKFSVHGLAGHLANQVFNVKPALDTPPEDGPTLSLLDHYVRSNWIDGDVDSDINVGIRERGERHASGGPVDLVERVTATVEQLREPLAAAPPDRAVLLPWAGWNLVLDDFLITRMMEIAVHSDDLAVSVGIDTPDLPPPVLDPVLALLTQLSVHKRGQPAVLRALTRAERAPTDITAF